jgi:hypothetical protein
MAIVLAREDSEVPLHAPQTKIEHFWVWNLEKLLPC